MGKRDCEHESADRAGDSGGNGLLQQEWRALGPPPPAGRRAYSHALYALENSMEIRRDPVTQSWVVSGQRERPEEGEIGCPFDPPAIDNAKTILSWPPEGPWQIRVLPHPEPLYRVENDPGRAAEGIYDKMGPLGAHEVVVETPQHDKRFTSFSDDELDHVLGVWGSRIADLKNDPRFTDVTGFKNQR